MDWFTGSRVVGLVTMTAILVLVGRRMTVRHWVPVVAVTLGLVLLVVLAERGGVWPAAWRLGR